MKSFYIVFTDLETSDQQGVFVNAPNERMAIASMGTFVEIVEVLEFDEDESWQFGLDSLGGDYDGDDDEPRELDFGY